MYVLLLFLYIATTGSNCLQRTAFEFCVDPSCIGVPDNNNLRSFHHFHSCYNQIHNCHNSGHKQLLSRRPVRLSKYKSLEFAAHSTEYSHTSNFMLIFILKLDGDFKDRLLYTS